MAPAQSWPAQLVGALRSAGQPVRDPEIIARTGWTAEELSAAIDATRPEGPFELVSVLVGVNNQFRGRLVGEYETQFDGVLSRAARCAGGDTMHVLVVSIPDWGVTPFASGRDRYRTAIEIDAFNAVNRARARAAGTRYVDITPASREAATDASLIANDGLHPSGRMYAAWVELILPEALRALAAP